jgi:hypothetical protein
VSDMLLPFASPLCLTTSSMSNTHQPTISQATDRWVKIQVSEHTHTHTHTHTELFLCLNSELLFQIKNLEATMSLIHVGEFGQVNIILPSDYGTQMVPFIFSFP